MRKFLYKISILIILMLFSSTASVTAGDIKPANAAMTPEARALLEVMYTISGKYILTGQHNFPDTKSRSLEFAASYIGKTPVIFSADFGFAREGDKDNYRARPEIIKEAIRLHTKGHIIALCWHAVPPTADEPVTFQPLRNRPAAPESLASVQGQLLDQQYVDLLTPGTILYNRWCAQVDSIAGYLKILQANNVPVLWRPYHEMNGEWFWWGGRHGKYGTAAIYKQIFERFTNYHKLNNLIWVWSVDKPLMPNRQFSYYYPGNDYLDILGLDVYGSDFKQAYYDSLLALSQGKPLSLPEVGPPPSAEVLKNQPLWTSYAPWAGGVRGLSKKQYAELIKNSNTLYMEDAAYMSLTREYRKVCGLPQLLAPARPKTDFSGWWKLNEEESDLGGQAADNFPDQMKVRQNGICLVIKKTFLEEFSDDRTTTDTLMTDGIAYQKVLKSVWSNAPVVISGRWTGNSDTLTVNSLVTISRDGLSSVLKTDEKWSLQKKGKQLVLSQTSDSPRGNGKRKVKLIFNRIQF